MRGYSSLLCLIASTPSWTSFMALKIFDNDISRLLFILENATYYHVDNKVFDLTTTRLIASSAVDHDISNSRVERTALRVCRKNSDIFVFQRNPLQNIFFLEKDYWVCQSSKSIYSIYKKTFLHKCHLPASNQI